MKKFFAAVCAIALLVTGCGGDSKPDKPASQDKTTIGVIVHLNASEEAYNKLMQKLEKSYRPSKANLSANYKYFDTLKSMQLALEGGQIEMLSTYQCVAKYMMQHSDRFEPVTSERNLHDSFCMAVSKGNTILLNDLNKAIKSMTEDGTLAQLTQTYIVDVDAGSDPPAVEIEQMPGAETIKVAVTGDLPPLDLILPDGTPAGFTTAVMAEMSKRLGKNVELISVDSAARASILTSKAADVVFWVSVPKDSTLIPANIDKPEGIIISEPYYNDAIVHLELKN